MVLTLFMGFFLFVPGIRELSSQVNVNLMKLVKKIEKQRSVVTSSIFKQDLSIHQLELESLVEVLSQQLQRGRVETKLASLRWVYHLFKICQQRVSQPHKLKLHYFG